MLSELKLRQECYDKSTSRRDECAYLPKCSACKQMHSAITKPNFPSVSSFEPWKVLSESGEPRGGEVRRYSRDKSNYG
jgi:hypothetical protein